MNFLITLEAARANVGYTMQEAAVLFGIHQQTLSSYEKDSSNVPFSFVDKVPQIYKVPKVNIFLVTSTNLFVLYVKRICMWGCEYASAIVYYS